MYDPPHRTFDMIADGIGTLVRRRFEFPHVRHELPRNGICRVSRVDEFGHCGRHGDRIALAHARDVSLPRGRQQTGIDEIARGAKCLAGMRHAGGQLSVSWSGCWCETTSERNAAFGSASVCRAGNSWM